MEIHHHVRPLNPVILVLDIEQLNVKSNSKVLLEIFKTLKPE